MFLLKHIRINHKCIGVYRVPYFQTNQSLVSGPIHTWDYLGQNGGRFRKTRSIGKLNKHVTEKQFTCYTHAMSSEYLKLVCPTYGGYLS